MIRGVEQMQIPESAKELVPKASGERQPLVLMTRPPDDPMLREEIGGQVWAAILMRFEKGLSEQDRTLWHNPPERVKESPGHLRVMHAFDDFLLGQFAEWGWRLLMSVGVLQRISEWEKHNTALLDRLGKQLALRSNVLHGENCAPFPEDIDVFADGAIEELGRLLRLQVENFRDSRRGVSCKTMAAWMQAEIEAKPKEFPLLQANLAQLHGFVHNLPRRDAMAARTLRRGDMRPRGFFLLWFARCSNRSMKDVQNEISGRRAQRRSTTSMPR